ncbi:hypothetical protein ACO0LD_28520 [Undibacterium sp. Ji83W]|uniref:hypothetical protein n=1 Tax=Undibacterium sp. Ji83W TaxID=3413043 RepID=UPI003BF27AEE
MKKLSMRLKSRSIVIAGVILVSLMYAYDKAIPPGFCATEKRVITDEEICAKQYDAYITAGYLKLDKSEKTGMDYFKHHPSYCRVDRAETQGFRLRGLIEDLDGRLSINLKYELTEQGKKSQGVSKTTIWDEWLYVTPCGRFIKRDPIEAS